MSVGSEELTHLLDANVLIALSVRDHSCHEAAHTWLATTHRIAVCPITEGALVRFLLREGESPSVAQAIVAAIRRLPACEFWRADLSYRDIDLTGVYGHRQVTDSYLVALASTRPADRLATFDRALAARHPGRCHAVAPF